MKRATILTVTLVGSVVAAAAVYLVVVPRLITTGDTGRALVYLVLGWIPYTLAFYVVGRLGRAPEGLPNMRLADYGLPVFLFSLLASIGLDRWGLTPERFPEMHLLQAAGVFVGLAMFGWGMGHRSSAIDHSPAPDPGSE